MPFWENLPYTNFHGVNQDWIINQTKHLIEEWAAYGDNLQQAYDTFTASVNAQIADLNGDWTDYKDEMNAAFAGLHDYVYNYFDNLDVQDEIDHKMDEMTAQGLWDDILHSFFDSYTNVIDQKVADQDAVIEQHTQAVALMRKQMDTFLRTHGTVSATLREVTNLYTGAEYQGQDNIELTGLLSNYDLIEVRLTAWGQNCLQYFKPSDFFTTTGASFRTSNQTDNEAISPAGLSIIEANIKAYDHEEGITYTHDTIICNFAWWLWHGGAEDESVQTLSSSNIRLRSINGIKYTDISAQKDAELTDIRIGADGTVYPTAGDAVRSYSKGFVGFLPEYTSWNTITKPGWYYVGPKAALSYTDYPSNAAPGILEVIRVKGDGSTQYFENDMVLQRFYADTSIAIRCAEPDPDDDTIPPGGWILIS